MFCAFSVPFAAGRLIFELGGIPERELEKLKEEANRLGKSSFAFAFYMDTQKEERARGVTISCTTKVGDLNWPTLRRMAATATRR